MYAAKHAGRNRVVLATDGDFNVGTFDQRALETMVADQRKSGVALTTLGFGTGNYNDAMAERRVSPLRRARSARSLTAVSVFPRSPGGNVRSTASPTLREICSTSSCARCSGARST